MRFSVLINSSPASFFNSSRGVRQGDPLSPFLFVIVIEVLSRVIIVAIDNGRHSGFSVGSRLSELVNISHLLFVNDTLVFCGVNFDHIRSIRALLVCFEAVSGLKVNKTKSVLILVGTVGNVGDLASILGCRTDSLPLKYLGLPPGLATRLNPFGITLWKKLNANWLDGKGCNLSKADRVTLIKSTISNLPTYFLSLFPIPVSVANRIEKLHEAFYGVG
jgi:hypothetical protein